MDDVFTETELRELSKHLGSAIPKKGGSLNDAASQHLEKVLQKIVHTVASAKLTLTHGAAAWNSLYGFLELGLLSSDVHLRKLCFASRTWLEVFELFLSRSQNAKAKPLTQVLRTLTKLLLKQPDPAVKQSLKEYAVVLTVAMIYEQGEFSLVKPAFQVLENFLDRGVIDCSDVVEVLARNYGFREHPKTVHVSRGKSHIPSPASLSLIESVTLTKAFIARVLEWLKYPDIAPIAGRLLLSFFKHAKDHPAEHIHPCSPENKLPLWVAPLRDFIKREPALLEICEAQVLPGLLRLSSIDALAFLDTLPLKLLREGNAGSHDLVEIKLCLSVLKICEGNNVGKALVNNCKYDENDLQCIAFSLLTHPSSTIRIAALSLVTSTISFTSPILVQTLTKFQHFIPYFHAEVNPKIRNEFIGLIEKFCDKLARAFSILHKSYLADQETPSTLYDDEGEREIAEDELATAHRLVEKQFSFSKWYIVFLIEELHPAASYQRHISALKMLDALLQIVINGGGSKRLFDPVSIFDDKFFSKYGQFYGSRCVRLLSDLIMDSFDDVRLAASSILRILLWNVQPWNMDFRLGRTAIDSNLDALRTLPHRTYNTYVFDALCRAEETMYFTGRADHADGVGRLYSMLHSSCKELEESVAWFHNGWTILSHLLSALEDDIKIAKSDIHLAVKTAPLHGKLLALRYIISSEGFYDLPDSSDPDWSARRNVNEKILGCCVATWEAVKEVLCFDSPGVYEELEEGEGVDLGIGTKDTSSFCWRALKESSALMNLMVTNNRYSSSNSGRGFRYEDFQTLGNLTFTQLSELRHRGAFSAVSQTFSACCRKCAQAKQSHDLQVNDSRIPYLPLDWYKNALNIIEENASDLTRRSAGIPAIITGILSAFPSGEFFDHVILDLQAIADAPVELFADFEDLRLPHVHALNCLKDVFTDALLGPASEPHIADTLEIAADCLESNIWAIRNCGLMLFKALLSRLNGGTDTASSRASSSHRRFSRLAYEKYPNLPNLILKLLSQSSPASSDTLQIEKGEIRSFSLQAQKVFPALEIVERSGLPSQQRTEIREAIRHHMEGPIWAIREKAAKASALVLDDSDFVNEIKHLLEADGRSQNALHGRLLYVRFIIARQAERDQREAIFLVVLKYFKHFISQNNCPFTVGAYVDILADGLEHLIKDKSKNAREHANFLHSLFRQSSVEGCTFSSTGEFPNSALLSKALKRCLTLIDDALDLLPRVSSDAFSTALETLPKPFIEKEPIFGTQDFEIGSKFDKLHLISDPADLEGSPAALNVTQRISQINPQQSDDLLRLTGSRLGLAYSKDYGDSRIRAALAAWSCRLSLAVDEHSDIDTRLAAADSVAQFISTLQDNDFCRWPAPELLGVHFALYNILLDDDEDVRDKGAMIASGLLSASTKNQSGGDILLMPCAASSRLLQYLVAEYRQSATLWSIGVCRLTGAVSSTDVGLIVAGSHSPDRETDQESAPHRIQKEASVQLRPVHDMLQDAMRQDTTLFTKEKQNLFLDPVKETKNWTEAVLRLQPHGTLGLELIPDLATWCIQGLTALVEVAESRDDGPLGWTSKPDVFALGIRILSAVRVRTRCLDVINGEMERSVYIGLLKKLVLVGKEKLLHGLWLLYLEEILEEIS